jgi:catalase
MDSMKKPDLAGRSIDSIEEVAGRFPGHKRAHARGSSYAGTFKPNGKAAYLTSAPHLQHDELPVIIRFSNSSTNPGHSDALTPPKGMAVQFQLPDGSITNLVCTTVPLFFARTPESFSKIMQLFASIREGKPDLKSLISIAKDYPESRAFIELIQEVRLPASYAAAPYYSIHAFYLTTKEGGRQPVKFIWEPEAGVSMYTKKEAATHLGNTYLEAELDERLAEGPVRFTLAVQLGEKEDPTDDPTVLWPGNRQKLAIGELTVTHKSEEGNEVFFDPTILPEGIECSEDPILHFRHEAYHESRKRREGENQKGIKG